MKKRSFFSLLLMLVLAALTLTACGKTEFTVIVDNDKRMLISAEKAEKDKTFTVGTLEVEDGEQIMVTADLSKGSIRVEILKAPEALSADAVPDGDVILTANLKTTEGASATFPAGSFLLRATCLEKATGTVLVEVKPAS